ncbi:MAG TPA: aminotransferase class V-fold PLP-dependent enzyme [Candidatus Thalassarchaeaceae archaeon]|nr:aminotransferase class V-fold PLP-dependent enzyme [Candidatus Thalassarchaeaceae archaeon]
MADILSVQRLQAIAQDEIQKWSKGIVHPASGSSESSDASSIAIEEARQKIESLLPGGNVWFTSGPDEAANWAIKGIAAAQRRRGNKIIASPDSHLSILNATRSIQGEGDVVAITGSAINIETGVLLDAQKWAHNASETYPLARRIIDARGAIGRIELEPLTLVSDAIILDSETCGGPAGVGALWIRTGVRIEPLIHGSGQEKGRRSGTVPIGLVCAFAAACIEADMRRTTNTELWNQHHSQLEEKIRSINGEIHGASEARAPGITCASIPGEFAEIRLQHLEERGIIASPASGCSSTAGKPSHVLTSMGIDTDTAMRSLRFSLPVDTSSRDLNRLLEALQN